MNCARCETLLSAYLDRSLDVRVCSALEGHLEQCRACRELLEQVQALETELSHFPTIDLPLGLVDRILEQTSGRPRERSLWKDLLLPTVSPFLSQRYAFATLMMFVFLSLMVNLGGPGFSALSASNLEPSSWLEESYQFSNRIYRKWVQLEDLKTRLVEEIKLFKEDLSGRLDYHLINLLFKSYSESLAEQEKASRQEQAREGETPSGQDKDGR